MLVRPHDRHHHHAVTLWIRLCHGDGNVPDTGASLQLLKKTLSAPRRSPEWWEFLGVSGNRGVFPSGTMLLHVAHERGCCWAQRPADIWIWLFVVVCSPQRSRWERVGWEFSYELRYEIYSDHTQMKLHPLVEVCWCLWVFWCDLLSFGDIIQSRSFLLSWATGKWFLERGRDFYICEDRICKVEPKVDP